MVRKITIRTGSIEKAGKEFINAWHNAEQTRASDSALEKISFADQALLFKTLTPRRFEILSYVHQKNNVSIRQIAKDLGRDYSNVHQDVTLLAGLGLMIKDKVSGTYNVPWDVIVTEIKLPSRLKRRSTRVSSM